MLLARPLQNTVLFYDSYGRPLLSAFPFLSGELKRLYAADGAAVNDNFVIKQIFPSQSLKQAKNTTLCGLYCIFMAHHIFTGNIATAQYATEDDVLRFANENFGMNFPRFVIYNAP